MNARQVILSIVVDNQAADPFQAEHGLAILIEAGGRRILFDTGQGNALPANARTMGLDLSTLDAVVLSHGHYDHTGGLPYALWCAKAAEVFLHPDVFVERFSIRPAAPPKAVHMPESVRRYLENYPPEKVRSVSAPLEIFPKVHITGPIPRNTDYEDTGGGFFLDSEGRKPDPIRDDQALWLETERGLVIVLGCCHAGVENTINYIRNTSGRDRIHAIMGGLHLLNADSGRMDRTLAYLQTLEIAKLYACHCTGEAPKRQLKRVFPGQVAECGVGSSLCI